MIRKEPSPNPGCIRVTFEIPAHVRANCIYLVGDFNGWDAGNTVAVHERWHLANQLESTCAPAAAMSFAT